MEIMKNALEIGNEKSEIKAGITSNKPDSVLNKTDLTDVIHKEFDNARSDAKPITSSVFFGISDEDIDLDVNISERVLVFPERFELALICME